MTSPMTRFFTSCSLLGLTLGLMGCPSPPDYPNTPAVAFESVRFMRAAAGTNPVTGSPFSDTIQVAVSFQDGDGDLGLNTDAPAEDTQPPFDANSPFVNNFFSELYIRRGGEYVQATLGGTPFTLSGRFPRIADNNQGPLEGVIRYNMVSQLISQRIFAVGDTIQLRVWIVDRALNESNRIFTPDVVVEGRR